MSGLAKGALTFPLRTKWGEGGDPLHSNGEGEVCLRGTRLSVSQTHLTLPLLRCGSLPLPPQAGGEGLVPDLRP